MRGPRNIWVFLAAGYIDLTSGRVGWPGEMDWGEAPVHVYMMGRDKSAWEESIVELRRGGGHNHRAVVFSC